MTTLPPGVVVADTITKLGPECRAAVIVSGSHGGAYPGYLACKAGARALVLNDAGVGKDDAGIGSLPYCQALGVAAATVGHRSARIGDAEDMLARGIISYANDLARALGCVVGLDCRTAARLLTGAPLSQVQPPAYLEARTLMQDQPGPFTVVCLDSVSLVRPEDAGQIIITGSHGGLVGGNKATALHINAFAAFYNDAGIGPDGAGLTRLPALDERGIAAATVGAASARIGDGRSTYYDGVISALNQRAEQLGGRIGMRAWEFVALLQGDGAA